ncbi:uncharacterized protein BP01DRAFT_396797 [Aspergillus saccharolyticus JOP 1030-1]|uniref:Uncharacterized protein n=1 Tax=Aspergillus saccharolyticus JOP 1030-1 TaxID=1450539 RepID=A0A319A282_9EURO|nr:hypothetical protein BP01DRAFT_396797 [Aspergillus saccharolyticus JOP 1030-1]PYH46378.1 hypothetical protein BP01DRAFT_396797 [Aspergillus saccharolyticus JOP 1030-1]
MSSSMVNAIQDPLLVRKLATSDTFGPEAFSHLCSITTYHGIRYREADEPSLVIVGDYGATIGLKFTLWPRSFFNTCALPRSLLTHLVPKDEQDHLEVKYGFNWSSVSVEARLISVPTCKAHWTMTLAENRKSVNISPENQELRLYDDFSYMKIHALVTFKAKGYSIQHLSANVWFPDHLKQNDTCRCVDWIYLNFWNFGRNGFLDLSEGLGDDLFTFLQQKRYEAIISAAS